MSRPAVSSFIRHYSVASMPINLFAQHSLSLRKTAIGLLIAMVLMLLDSKNPDWFTNLRHTSHATMQPIYQMSVMPSFVGHWAGGTLMSKEALRRENVQLHAELLHANAKLQQQDYVLAQNARLQGILSTTKPLQHSLHLAQVIGTDTNPLKQIVVINKGSNDHVAVGQTVIDERGILGQIVNVYPNTSRLLLLTDDTQSVAVTVKRTGQRAIVSGQGFPQALKLDYIFKTADIRIGDELISSGLGGRFPAGYQVGRVYAINPVQQNEFMDIDVTPAANFVDSAYVLVMQEKPQSTPFKFELMDETTLDIDNAVLAMDETMSDIDNAVLPNAVLPNDVQPSATTVPSRSTP